ncbi:MAG: hypothetical protein SVZ03_00025 [Spirochaetota bacterium]|nr:hypothetical protein [Spirochaetota bacterium]
MNSKMINLLLVLFLVMIPIADCAKDEDRQIILSGNLEIEDEAFGPAFVAISITDDIEKIENDPYDTIVQIVTVDTSDYSFNVDLSESDLIPGQEIFIFGFVDNDFNYGIPVPGEGDYVGFYFDFQNWKPSYVLQEGHNDGMNIEVKRRVYNFDAKVSGVIDGDYIGNIILVAYAGELTSMTDFGELDINGIVGYQRLFKGDSALPYSLRIFPYGYNIPIKNVLLLALFDDNKNGKPDAGDMIGFYSDEYYNLPRMITIHEETMNDRIIHSDPSHVIKLTEPSGYNIPICGSLHLPEGEIYDETSSPLFLFIAETDDPTQLLDDPFRHVKYFKKIEPPVEGPPPEEEVQSIEFNILLSETDLREGDEISIGSIWDMDYSGGLPFPTQGDYIGFYIDSFTISPTYKLQNHENSDINIHVNRMIYSFESKIEGTCFGCDTGELTIIAYAGEIYSFNFMDALDFNYIIGYQKKAIDLAYSNYSLGILPYGYDVPIQNVYLLAMLDKNGNGICDAGDMIGYHTVESNNLPSLLTVDDGLISNKHINMTMEIAEPSGYEIPIIGSLEIPEGEVYDEDSDPLYLIIAKTNYFGDIFDDPVNVIKYFQRIKPPERGIQIIGFNIDLSQTDLQAGDDIIVSGIWDKDLISGFPFPTEGDYVGFYINYNAFSPTYRLQNDMNDEINIKVNRSVYGFDSTISGTVEGGDAGELTIIAYALDINLLNLDFINVDNIIAYQKIEKGVLDQNYTLEIFPYGRNVPIANVLLIAFLDINRNGFFDGGDYIGYHIADDDIYFPSIFTVVDGENSNKDIKMIIHIPSPEEMILILLDTISQLLEDIFG